MGKSSVLVDKSRITPLNRFRDSLCQTKFVPGGSVAPNAEARRTRRVQELDEAYRARNSQSLSMDLTPSTVQGGTSSGEIAADDDGGVARHEAIAIGGQDPDADTLMADASQHADEQSMPSLITDLLGCSNTIYHQEIEAVGGGVARHEATDSPALDDDLDNNFTEYIDTPAGIASDLFDAAAFTPGLVIASNPKSSTGESVDVQAASREAHERDISGGLASEQTPQVLGDVSQDAPAVNINQILAELIQANQRIATLEATVAEQQRRLDAADQVVGRPLDSASDIASDLQDAQQACNAVLMAVTHKYRTV